MSIWATYIAQDISSALCSSLYLELKPFIANVSSPSFTARRGDAIPPRVWLLIELELCFKNQRVACHETKPLTPEFMVLGQPVISEVRSMTQKWPKCDFADNFVFEQARAAI